MHFTKETLYMYYLLSCKLTHTQTHKTYNYSSQDRTLLIILRHKENCPLITCYLWGSLSSEECTSHAPAIGMWHAVCLGLSR